VSRWLWPGSTVVRVVDGDTFDALVHRDLGFGGQAVLPVRLRLNRINAPKGSTEAGKAATARVGIELGLRATVDLETINPYKYGGPKDMTGEWMAEVTLPDGVNLSDLLVEAGLAVYWDGQGPRPADEG
jgi:endonuclease YncB( thermonuclease family)